MAISGLKIWAAQTVSPGVPLGSVLNVTDSDLLKDGGVALTGLPGADAKYFTDNGGWASYEGTLTNARFYNDMNWDTIKDFKLAGEASALGGRSLQVQNYVHVDIDLSKNFDDTTTGTGVTLNIDGAKRGAFVTGNGDDTVNVGLTSNGIVGWSETFRVETGGGSDHVTFTGATSAGVVNSPYVNQYNDGHTSSILTDLGSGNDSFDAHTLGALNTVDGGSGSDVIWTGWGADSIEGGSGNDTITSGNGADWIDGGSGNDSIIAGDGNVDTLGGAHAGNTIDGGSGSDTIFSGSGDDNISGGSGSGADYIDSGAGADTILGDSGSDTVFAGAGDDSIIGGSGAEELHGGADNDFIVGNSGADKLWGDAGNDTINGGSGADSMWGGAGNDTFVYNKSDSGTDHIYDFSNTDDTLDLSAMGVTHAYLDSNNDGHVDNADAKATLNGSDLTLKLLNGVSVVLHGVTSVDDTHIIFV